MPDKLGFERCKNILLPRGQDANDYLKDHTKDDFIKLAATARKFKIPSIISIRDTLSTFPKMTSNLNDSEKGLRHRGRM